MTPCLRWMALGLAVLITACGGGGGDSGSPSLGGGGGGGGNTARAADLTLVLSAPTVSNSGSDKVTATVTAVDANRNTVPGIGVTFSVDAEATIQVSGAQTDAQGVVTGAISIGGNKVNRPVTITATSGTLTRTTTLLVIGTKLTATLLPAVLSPGAAGKVQFTLKDNNSNEMGGVAIVISGPSSQQTTAVTNAKGDYELSYVAPTTPGNYDIRASAGGVENLQSIIVQSGPGIIPVVTTLVQSASVSGNPSVVPVNVGVTNNRSEVRALFLAANNAPIKNIRVRFDLDGDANSIGGSFTSTGILVYSDVGGIAVSSYIPGARQSPTDGLTVRACWDYADFNQGNCPNAVRTNLTVVSEPLSVSIGTDEFISTAALGVYSKDYVVQVVDSSGGAKQDVLISPSLDLLQYIKGYYVKGTDSWIWTPQDFCENEDLNRNGVADIYSNGVEEDANHSFNLVNGRSALEPRKADVAWFYVDGSRTNNAGQIKIRLQYPRNLGSWVRFNLTVAASGVSGTEGRTNFDGILSVPGAALADTKVAPAFEFSPYGTEDGGAKVSVSPPGVTKVTMLCTNPK